MAFLELLSRAARTWIVATDVGPVGRRLLRLIQRSCTARADDHRVTPRRHLLLRRLRGRDVEYFLRAGRLFLRLLVRRNVLENAERVVSLGRFPACRTARCSRAIAVPIAATEA